MVPVTVPLVLEDLGRLLHRWRRPVLATWAVVVVLGAMLGGSVFDLAEAAAAHEELEKGHTRGKIVLRVSDD